VFFYSSADTDVQKVNLLNAAGLMWGLVQALRNATCKAVIPGFLCQNMFPRCINGNYSGGNGSFHLLYRQPLCQADCQSAMAQCQEVLSNQYLMSQINSFPDAAPYMNCSSTDDWTSLHLPNYPDSPGWVNKFNGNVSLNCIAVEQPTPSPPPPPSPSPSPGNLNKSAWKVVGDPLAYLCCFLLAWPFLA